MIEDKEYELNEYFFIENIEKDKLEIKLKNTIKNEYNK
jgi:hypothetical protein